MTFGLSLLDAGIDDVDIYESTTAVKELGVGIDVLPHAVRKLTPRLERSRQGQGALAG